MNDSFDENPEPFYLRFGQGFRLWLLLAVFFACAMIIGGLSKVSGMTWLEASFDNGTSPMLVKLALALHSVILYAVPAIVFANVFPPDRFEWFKAHKRPSLNLALYVGLIILGSMLFTDMLDNFNAALVTSPELKENDTLGESYTRLLLQMPEWTDLLINLFVLALVPAVCEELFFRGSIQQILREWTKNKHAAVLITAVVFSLLHFHFSGFISRAVMGAALGYIFLWSGSLQLSMLAHFLYNGLTIVLVYHTQHWPQSALTTWEPSLVVGIVSGLIMAGGMFVYYRTSRGLPDAD